MKTIDVILGAPQSRAAVVKALEKGFNLFLIAYGEVMLTKDDTMTQLSWFLEDAGNDTAQLIINVVADIHEALGELALI